MMPEPRRDLIDVRVVAPAALDAALSNGGRSTMHKPANTLLRIDALYAFVSVDADGHEGLCAMPLPGLLAPIPMIAADEARLRTLIPMAEALAKMSGMKIRLIKLTEREVIRDIS